MKPKVIRRLFDEAKVQDGSLIIMMGCAVWQVKGEQLVLVIRRNQFHRSELERLLLGLFRKLGYSIKEDKFTTTDTVNGVSQGLDLFGDNSIPSVVTLDQSMFSGESMAAMIFEKPAAAA